ncbi:MAG TPA: GDP-L-fucose synthase [Clostridia bacterium]
MEKGASIFVAGHKGLVGSAIVRNLTEEGYNNLILKSHSELDLTEQSSTESFFSSERPEYVFLAAAKVGGIGANSTYPADFIMQNLLIECNVIRAAWKYGVKKLIFLGSSCIYPKNCPQPIKEEYLLTGPLEPTNEAYALAKISGLKMCKFYNEQYGTRFISCMPTNLYGPNDNYDLENSHVLPALIRKFHEAKTSSKPFVELWGTGAPLREFLHVDDMASACIYLMKNYEGNEHVNIGSGEELTIKELAYLIKDAVGYEGEIRFDSSKPDGTYRKKLDLTFLNSLGWNASISLRNGIAAVYKEYREKNA